jgi:phosphoglycolate phosphatase-like HAD superfamily hydrolase
MHLLLDLDNSLCDDSWRLSLIGTDGGYDAYHSQLHLDKLVPEVLALVRAVFFAGWKIHAITARPEKWREATIRHLIKYTVPIDRVLMRGDKDFRPAPDVKMDLVMNNFPGIPYSQMIALDDREDCSMAYKSLGIVTLQVHRKLIP